jgi:hypothetical protein
MKFLAASALAITAVMSAAKDAPQCARAGEKCNLKASPPVGCCLADCYVPEVQTDGFVWLLCPLHYIVTD